MKQKTKRKTKRNEIYVKTTKYYYRKDCNLGS